MENQTNHYLVKESIGKLMLKFSIPCIVSLLVSSLYNIVDQIFIGRGVGMLGNGATNVVFPITIIALAFALLIGDGGAAFLSICQGRKDEKNAHRSVGNVIVVLILCSIILTVIFAIFRDHILWGFGATKNNIKYAEEYFNYIIIGIPFFMFGNAINSIVRADGSPQFAMITIFIGCIINIILDPIAIFVLHWGMMGAALATIMGQIVSALFVLYYLFHTKSFHLKKSSFYLRGAILRHIFPLGISSFLTQVSIVIIMAVMNNTLVIYGAQSKYGSDIPLTVVGIVMKVFQIVISVVVGIAAGAQPIVGYNYGANHYNRVKNIYKIMIAAELGVGLIAMFCFEVFPLQIIKIFGSEEGLYNEFAVHAFQIYLSTIILCCIQKATSIFLQSLGKPVLSMVLSLMRDIILIVPLIVLLPIKFGLISVLFSAPIADVVSFIVVIYIMVFLFKHLDKQDEAKYVKSE